MNDRSALTAIRRGIACTCPNCGTGALYKSYLKVNDICPSCGEELYHQRADDAPAYFTILIVAHIVGAGILLTEFTWHWSEYLQWAIWIPALVILSLGLLPRIKGALIGLQWANRMHGFGGAANHVTYAEPAPVKPVV